MAEQNNTETLVCTQCGAPMVSRSCKLRCNRCGYFEDCSDTGLPVYSWDEKNPIKTEEKNQIP